MNMDDIFNSFNQTTLVNLNIKLNEAILLSYFIESTQNINTIKKVVDGEIYFSVNYNEIKKYLPILNLSADRIYRLFKKLSDIGILNYFNLNHNTPFYSIGPNYHFLVE